MTEFDKYIRQGEPDQKEKAAAWQVAIGLQDVDGLKPSEYLIQTAQQHIEGEISIDEVKHLIDTYNPQNEMFRLLGTKRSFSQNETFFFSHPYPALFRLISHF